MKIELATAKLLERAGRSMCYNRYTKIATITQEDAMMWLRIMGIRFYINEQSNYILANVNVLEGGGLFRISLTKSYSTYAEACEELIKDACKYLIKKEKEGFCND